jgi:ribosomal protein L11 methyltransferase
LRNCYFSYSCWNERRSTIDAIDIDNWCYLNSIENAERNNGEHITVYEGDALLKTRNMIWLSNINRNILLNDMQSYVDCLTQREPFF